MEIKIDDKQVQATLDRVVAVAENPDGALFAAGKQLEARVRHTFRDEADPWGAPWPPLSPVTVAMRAKRGSGSDAPLVDSGRMFDSLRTERGEGAASVVMGGPGMWPGVHQRGNPDNRMYGRAPAPIPARPMFPIRDDGVELPGEWAQALLEPLEHLMQQAIDGTE
jgi:phage gpG-like protein